MREEVLSVQIQSPATNWVPVGHLVNRDERNWFEISPSYWGVVGRPILGQIFEEHGKRWRPHAHVALPRWFSHLLPEGVLRDAVAAASEVNRVREFQLIRRLGSADLPGAIRVVPESNVGDFSAPDFDAEEDGGPTNRGLKFSLAGAQLKFSRVRESGGFSAPAKGSAGDWIVKMPDLRPGFGGVPEAESGALRLSRESGLETVHAELVKVAEVEGLSGAGTEGGENALAVARFDRIGNSRRVHFEELAQVLDIPTSARRKYTDANFETVARTVSLISGVDEVGVVIDRIVLNVLIGNGDAHLKNWAFIYKDGISAKLAPAYDIVPTVLYIKDDDLGLNLNGSKRFESVTSGAFRRLGDSSGYGGDAAVLRASEAADRVRSNWSVLSDYLTAGNYDALTRRLGRLSI